MLKAQRASFVAAELRAGRSRRRIARARSISDIQRKMRLLGARFRNCIARVRSLGSGDARTDAALRRPGKKIARGLVNYALSMATRRLPFFFASSRMAVSASACCAARRGECLGRSRMFGGRHKCASGLFDLTDRWPWPCPEFVERLHEEPVGLRVDRRPVVSRWSIVVRKLKRTMQSLATAHAE